MAADEDEGDASRFRIFRARDAVDLLESGCMMIEPYTPVQQEGMDKVIAAGFLDGGQVHVLVDLPGFSLAHVWFKAGYPLPLHSHDADCLYYIVAGAIRLGTEELGPGDSFFIPCDVPYTYKPGPDGVELLEFRHEGAFNFVNCAKGAGFWEKAVQQVVANREAWKVARRPALNP